MCVTSIHSPGDAFMLLLKCYICGFANASRTTQNCEHTYLTRWLLKTKLLDSRYHLEKDELCVVCVLHFWKSICDLTVIKINE